MLTDLERLVCCESPSTDIDSLHRCADVVSEIVEARLDAPPVRTETGGKPLLRVGPADPAVLLLAHLDTVHPLGTLAEVPFSVAEGRATGPGIFDMKTGLVQAVHALAAVGDRSRTALLVTADEELGSTDSRAAIEATAGHARATFVLEASSEGRLKTARKGTSDYRLELSGRAAHAGLEPEKGANASIGLAHAIVAVARLADPDAGTTVTPTMAGAGSSANTVPEAAWLAVDVRATTADEQARVHQAVPRIASGVEGVELSVRGGINRPPLEQESSTRLFALAQRAATDLGLKPLDAAHVGGASDGNFTAALGVDTLDGLGAVGAGAHTRHEWVDVTAIGERTALLTRLIEAVTTEVTGGKP